MITHSLHNLLLDDQDLDDQPLVGPVVPMRWMSNLFRLAMLEETDRQNIADGQPRRHLAEIRRLARMSMHPSVGHYYPVADHEPEQISPDQARQIVEAYRARQPIPQFDDALENDFLNEAQHDDDNRANDDPEFGTQFVFPADALNTTCLERSRREHEPPNTLSYDDYPVDEPDEQPRPSTNERRERPRAVVRNDGLLDYECPESEDIDDGSPFSDEPHWRDHEEASHPIIAFQTKHETQNTKHQTQNPKHQTRPNRTARFATDVAIAIFAALLLVAATWFLKAGLEPTAPPPAPDELLSTTKIVPSAVPKHQTPNTNPEPRTPNPEP